MVEIIEAFQAALSRREIWDRGGNQTESIRRECGVCEYPSPPRQDDVEILPVDFHGKALHLSPPVGEAFPCPYLELPAVHGARDDVRLIARVMLAHPAVILNVSRDLAKEVPRADGALLVGTFIFEREKPVAQPEYPELKALQFEANPLAGAYLGRPRRPEPPRHLCAHL